MRAVVDPNVVVAGVLAPGHAPAALLSAWVSGAFEIVVCPRWLAELERAVTSDRLEGRVTMDESSELLELLGNNAEMNDDPGEPTVRSPDPGDDYLIALAAALRVALVSADPHLLGLREKLPVHTPTEFLQLVETLA